ncbi:hypothetical protein D3C77_396720 [compost metagenome]
MDVNDEETPSTRLVNLGGSLFLNINVQSLEYNKNEFDNYSSYTYTHSIRRRGIMDVHGLGNDHKAVHCAIIRLVHWY